MQIYLNKSNIICYEKLNVHSTPWIYLNSTLHVLMKVTTISVYGLSNSLIYGYVNENIMAYRASLVSHLIGMLMESLSE